MDTHRNAADEAMGDENADPGTEDCDWLPLEDADDCAAQCEYAGCYPWLVDFIGAHPYDPTLRAARAAGAPAFDDMDTWGY